MDSWLGGASAFVALATFFFLVVLTILWILVPFAIFGTKALLRQILAELRRANDISARAPVAPGTSYEQRTPTQYVNESDQGESTLDTIRNAVRQARNGDAPR